MFRALLPVLAAGLIIAGPALAADQTVVITQAQPIESIDKTDGHCTGVNTAAVGATYRLVKQDGDQLILSDATGVEYEIPIVATNYTPPAPKPAAPAPTTNTASISTNAAPATITNSAPAAAATAPSIPSAAMLPPGTSPPGTSSAPDTTTDNGPKLSKDDADKLEHLNDALSLTLLTNKKLWDENVDDVAQRLGWPQESKTDTETSYRRYANQNEVMVCGASAYSLALYGKNGKPTYLSLVFANLGDFPEARKLGYNSRDSDAIDAMRAHLADAVKKDGASIAGALSGILGDPTVSLFGNSSSNRDEVHRWDFNGAAFLLNTHEGQYCSLKIIPTTVADNYGTEEVTDRDGMKDLLAKRVVKRENGDVILSQVPMVDQGPKGYCVPATWERYLRYMDVPADLYVLAIMGHSGMGGGTGIVEMNDGVNDYVSAYHRRLEICNDPIDADHVARYIDQGLPLMWSCWVRDSVEKMANDETNDRKSAGDLNAYADKLKAQDRKLGDSFVAHYPEEQNAHMRLIIGYNQTTNEIAISDSWGQSMAERWIYAPTATRVNQGSLFYLSW